MANRVIKDSIWSSKTLASLSEKADDSFPRWLLQADDWGCFNSDSPVIKGSVYPYRDTMTVKKINALKQEYYNAGLIFFWVDGEREWGYFVSFESHHNYCNRTNANDDGKNQKHRRKTPEPPIEAVTQYLQGDRSYFGHLGTVSDKILNPIPNPISISNPNPNPNPNGLVVLGGFDIFWNAYPKKKSKAQAVDVWRKLKPNEQLQASILSGLERAKTSVEWTKENGRYIPKPHNWLKDGCWEDDYQQPGMQLNLDRYRDIMISRGANEPG